jgi:hypothetical protein
MSATSHGNTNHLRRALRVGELCEAIAAGELRPRKRDGNYYISSRDIERLAEARERDTDLVPDLGELHDLPDLHVSSLA